MPPTIPRGLPVRTVLATQLTMVMTAPTERSSPPIRTGTVCAIATMPRTKASFAFWTRTSVEKPFGCSAL